MSIYGCKQVSSLSIVPNFIAELKGKRGIKLSSDTLKAAAKVWTKGELSEDSFAPIAEFDASEVTDMEYLFKDLEEFNEDLSRWKTGKVMTMRGLFFGFSSSLL